MFRAPSGPCIQIGFIYPLPEHEKEKTGKQRKVLSTQETRIFKSLWKNNLPPCDVTSVLPVSASKSFPFLLHLQTSKMADWLEYFSRSRPPSNLEEAKRAIQDFASKHRQLGRNIVLVTVGVRIDLYSKIIYLSFIISH